MSTPNRIYLLGNYLAFAAGEMGLNQRRSTGLLTNARMHCRSYSAAAFEKIIVEVLVTAGVDKNAVCAGDPALYYENRGQYRIIGGTINIFAFTNANLSHVAMAKALLTITEGKSAALQELAVVSPVTLTPATGTGTGTGGVILACDQKSDMVCTDTGTQAKLGELFCVAVKKMEICSRAGYRRHADTVIYYCSGSFQAKLTVHKTIEVSKW